MGLTPVWVDVQRETRTGDGSGGKTVAWTTVLSSLEATLNFPGRTSELIRLEQAAHNTQGPGVQSQTRKFFTFRQQPQPDIRQQDRIVTPDGVRWVVQNAPRRYDLTMQVDVELVS